ncbi:MAG: winged helix-turn-helix transcriptional regulator [Armatimonadetes bacterium]|nr:winged helix-turn-helix transcriptional regulator [Armatimonadota bacterium]
MLDTVDPALLPLLAERFQALGDPLRLRILQVLDAGERTVSELVECVGTTQPNVSRHVARLEQAGLVARRRVGGCVVVSLAEGLKGDLCDHLCALIRRQAAATAALTGSTPSREE